MARVVLVVGTGSIGMRHLDVLAGLDGVHAVALPTRTSRVAELESLGHRTVGTIEEALALKPFAAIVATDTGRHVEDARMLLAAGCPVLVEKPLTTSASALTPLTSNLGAKDKLFVGCCLRFNAGLLRFRARIGSVGTIHHVRIECQSYLPDWRPGTDYRRSYSARSAEGGVLRDLVHEIDYGCWLFGRPHTVSAMLTTESTTLDIEAEGAADVWWRSPSMATISIRLDYLTRTSRRRMTAFGDGGELEWDAIANTVVWRPAGANVELEHVDFDRNVMMRAQAEAFLRAAAGEPPGDLATFDDGAFTVALCDAARVASATNAAVSVATKAAAAT